MIITQRSKHYSYPLMFNRLTDTLFKQHSKMEPPRCGRDFPRSPFEELEVSKQPLLNWGLIAEFVCTEQVGRPARLLS